VVLHLVAERAAEGVGARLADGIDREAGRTVEVDRLGAALDHRDLAHVVRGRLGREGSEKRHVDVDAVEIVDVVLAAAAGAGAAEGVVGVLHAGDQLDQVAVLLADRQRFDHVGGDRRLELGRGPVDQGGLGDHLDLFGDRVDRELDVDRGGLLQQHLDRTLLGRHAVEGVAQGVFAGRQQRQAVFALLVGHRLAGLRQHVGRRFDRHARQVAGAARADRADDRAGLLGERRSAETEHANAQQRTGCEPIPDRHVASSWGVRGRAGPPGQFWRASANSRRGASRQGESSSGSRIGARHR
jgi:hypothetical protein